MRKYRIAPRGVSKSKQQLVQIIRAFPEKEQKKALKLWEILTETNRQSKENDE